VPSPSLQALLARAGAALDRGRGAEAAQMLTPALRSSALTRDDEFAVRSMLAEAWLLQDDLDQAGTALGRPPDTLRETLPPGRLSALWRLHGRVASARGDQSRAIAHHGRALKQAEIAHDSRAIGLAHYELGECYTKVGDIAIVREHISKAASALHAAGDRRHLALVHSLSGVSLAQGGRYDEAMGALRHAERLAAAVHADDVLALICGNQANVTMMQHRYEQALALAERSVALHEEHESGHGLAVALATLGQICVRLGDLARAEDALHRALDVRSPIQFHETTGAVFDTLAQIQLIRGRYDAASDYLGRAGDAYGAYGLQTSRWYEWSVRVLGARLALRRGSPEQALALADEILGAANLRRRVTLEREHRVVADHAASVVGDLDELLPPGFDADLYARGAGVERVLQHLLHHGSGALHHFAGGDLADEGIWEQANRGHGGAFFLGAQVYREQGRLAVRWRLSKKNVKLVSEFPKQALN